MRHIPIKRSLANLVRHGGGVDIGFSVFGLCVHPKLETQVVAHRDWTQSIPIEIKSVMPSAH